MTNIRVRCQGCGAVAALRPAQVLLMADTDRASGDYLFLRPSCERLTVRPAEAHEVQLLMSAGVADARHDRRPAPVHPPGTVDPGPLTPDDLLDFHLLLAQDDWFSQLA